MITPFFHIVLISSFHFFMKNANYSQHFHLSLRCYVIFIKNMPFVLQSSDIKLNNSLHSSIVCNVDINYHPDNFQSTIIDNEYAPNWSSNLSDLPHHFFNNLLSYYLAVCVFLIRSLPKIENDFYIFYQYGHCIIAIYFS